MTRKGISMATYKEVKVQFDQHVFDLAIQEYGGIEGVFDLIEDNQDVIDGMDAVLELGTVVNIKVDGSTNTNKDSQSYFKTKQLDIISGSDQSSQDYLLLEDGDYLLNEDGSKILR